MVCLLCEENPVPKTDGDCFFNLLKLLKAHYKGERDIIEEAFLFPSIFRDLNAIPANSPQNASKSAMTRMWKLPS